MPGRSNATRVREMHEAFGRRDLDAFLGYCAPEVRFHSDLGDYPTGHAGVRRWWADVIETFAVGPPRFALVVELGDVVLALVEATWRGRTSGVEFPAGRAQVSRWRNGRVEWWGFYPAVEEAIEAAGLDAVEAHAWEHVQVCLGVVDAINRRDVGAVLAGYHPEAETRTMLMPVGGMDVARGRDEIARYFHGLWDAFDSFELRPHEVRWDRGDTGVVMARTIARGAASGVTIDRDVTHVVTVRDELVYRQRAFTNRDEGLTVAGLSP